MSLALNYFLITIPIKKDVPQAEVGIMKKDLETKMRSTDKETQVHSFEIPNLKVGNIDSLIFLSDALKKTATTVESTIRKLSTQIIELEDPIVDKDGKEKKQSAKEIIEVRNSKPEDVLTRFKWEDARYPRRKSLPELTHTIKSQIAGIEKELRERLQEYTTICQKIAQLTANESGNLLTRDINSVIQEYNSKQPGNPFRPIESMVATTAETAIAEYNSGTTQAFEPLLITLYVVVPKNEIKNWLKTYNTLITGDEEKGIPNGIVPNSAVKLAEDAESVLFSVYLFSKDAEEFKNACRPKRYTVRKNDSVSVMDEGQKQELKANQQRKKKNLQRWVKANFGDAFYAWLHLKCIQCFVESVLRYGLPPDFEAMLISPKKGNEKKVMKMLCKEYRHLGGEFSEDPDSVSAAPEEKNALQNEKFFPFVFIDVNLVLN